MLPRRCIISKIKLIALGLPRSKKFSLGLLIAALQGIATVGLLATSAWLISRAAEMPPVLYLQLAVVGVRGFALGRATFRYVERLLLHDAAFKQLAILRPKVFSKLIPFAPIGTKKVASGEMLSRVTSDVDELQFLPLRVIAPVVQAFVVSVLSVVGLALLVPGSAVVLTLACLLACFVAVPVAGYFANIADKQNAAQRAQLSSQTLQLFESLDEFRAFGWVDKQISEVEAAEALLSRTAKRAAWSQGIAQASFAILSVLATAGSAFFAAQAFSAKELPGVWVAVATLLPLAVFDVLQNIQPVASAWRRFIMSAERVSDVITADLPKFLPVSDSTLISNLKPFERLQLTDVSLSYGFEPIIRNVNLALLSGEVLAISGPSGSGKSSLALALAGFLALESGSYLYNGLDTKRIDPTSLRKRVTYLQQHPSIFMGDLASNLRVAKPEAGDAEMVSALERVNLWATFEARQGLQTNLGELGRAMSGGEIARLALARALLIDFDVLILDEPTSNLDYETGQNLMAEVVALAKTRQHRAVIVITHDEDVAALADRRLVI